MTNGLDNMDELDGGGDGGDVVVGVGINDSERRKEIEKLGCVGGQMDGGEIGNFDRVEGWRAEGEIGSGEWIKLMRDPRVTGAVLSLYDVYEKVRTFFSGGCGVGLTEDPYDSPREWGRHFVESFNGEDADLYLAATYRCLLGEALGKAIEVLSDARIFRMVESLKAVSSEEEALKILFEEYGYIDEYMERSPIVFGVVCELGFDKKEMSVKKGSPLNPPFDSADIRKSYWADALEVGQNMVHALNKLFSLDFFNFCLFRLKNEKDLLINVSEFLKRAEDIPSFLCILRAFRSKLVCDEVSEKARVSDAFVHLKSLLDHRFRKERQLESGLPIECRVSEDVFVEYANPNELLLALMEVGKNSFRQSKVSNDELRGYAESGRPYMTFDARNAVLSDGREVVVIQIFDKGKPINIEKILDAMGDLAKGWESRDLTLGAMLDFLSARGVSIPLGRGLGSDEGSISTGIGLHSARKIILKHHGELFCANMKGGGVSFMIVIPKEGQESSWNVSDTKLSGADCGKLADGIVVEQGDTQEMLVYELAIAGGHIKNTAMTGKIPDDRNTLVNGNRAVVKGAVVAASA